MSNKGLSETARKARNDYIKSWREKNKDKVKVYNCRYWERQAEKMNAERGKNEEQKANT